MNKEIISPEKLEGWVSEGVLSRCTKCQVFFIHGCTLELDVVVTPENGPGSYSIPNGISRATKAGEPPTEYLRTQIFDILT